MSSLQSNAIEQLSFLRSLPLRLSQLMAIIAAPLGYFEARASFFPETYTISDLEPQIVSNALALSSIDKHSDMVVATYSLMMSMTK